MSDRGSILWYRVVRERYCPDVGRLSDAVHEYAQWWRVALALLAANLRDAGMCAAAARLFYVKTIGDWPVSVEACVACPRCAFTFAAAHEDDNADERYSCPQCAEERYRAALEHVVSCIDTLDEHNERTSSWSAVRIATRDAAKMCRSIARAALGGGKGEK